MDVDAPPALCTPNHFFSIKWTAVTELVTYTITSTTNVGGKNKSFNYFIVHEHFWNVKCHILIE